MMRLIEKMRMSVGTRGTKWGDNTSEFSWGNLKEAGHLED